MSLLALVLDGCLGATGDSAGADIPALLTQVTLLLQAHLALDADNEVLLLAVDGRRW